MRADGVAPDVVTSRGVRRRRWRRTLTPWLFASPWLVGFTVLIAGPIVATAYYSLTEFDGFNVARFVGFGNYRQLIDDERFRTSVSNTLYLTVIGVPLGLVLGLAVAMVLNLQVRGRALFRAVAYLPTIVPLVVTVYVWRWLLNAQYGYVNELLDKIGLGRPLWLDDPAWTKAAVLVLGAWTVGGTAIIYLAALRGVPKELYEAARIDRASRLQSFRHVTLPAIAPVTLFQLVVGVIIALQVFTQPYLLVQTRLNPAGGGPADSLLTTSMYVYQNAFVFLKMGYASAVAWVLFVVTLVITAVILGTSRWWVTYDS
jgi:multiple sugar transport system permease protein